MRNKRERWAPAVSGPIPELRLVCFFLLCFLKASENKKDIDEKFLISQWLLSFKKQKSNFNWPKHKRKFCQVIELQSPYWLQANVDLATVDKLEIFLCLSALLISLEGTILRNSRMVARQPSAGPTQQLNRKRLSVSWYVQEVLDMVFNATLNVLLPQPSSQVCFWTPMARKQCSYWPELDHKATPGAKK